MTQTSNPDLRIEDGVLGGPLRRSVNASAQSKGSIHDDATATKLGLRGGTVAGSIHMDLYPPLGLELFGSRWFEDGCLSLYFVNATVDREPVRAYVRVPEGDAVGRQLDTWVLREDGMRVAEGTMSAGSPAAPSALHTRDLVKFPAQDLRILANLEVGHRIDPIEVHMASGRQAERMAVITEKLPWYEGQSPWGGSIVTPAGMVQLLYSQPASSLRHVLKNESVGLFGAIEVKYVNGPAFVDESYRVAGEVVAIGDSPKTEFFWFDTRLDDLSGKRVAEMRMLLRFMKASSPLWAEG